MIHVGLDLGHPLCALGTLYLYVLVARVILSWIPISRDSGFAPVVHLVHAVTEPVIAPVRRVIPPAGMFDLSFLVVFFLFELVVLPILCRI